MSNVDKSASANTRKLRSRAIISFHTLNPITNEGGSAGVLTERRQAAVQFKVSQITNFAGSFAVLSNGNSYYPTYKSVCSLTWDLLPDGTTVQITSNFASDLIVYSGVISAKVYLLTADNYSAERIFTIITSSNNILVKATTKVMPA